MNIEHVLIEHVLKEIVRNGTEIRKTIHKIQPCSRKQNRPGWKEKDCREKEKYHGGKNTKHGREENSEGPTSRPEKGHNWRCKIRS